jgi:hypothetical protein
MFDAVTGRQWLLAPMVLFGLFIVSSTAFAGRPVADTEPTLSPLATDLAALVTRGQALDAELAAISLTPQNSCTELGTAGTSVADWLAGMESVYAGVSSPFSVDTESLASLDALSDLALGVAGRIETLSGDLNSLSATAGLIEYDASLAAMLRLTDDIGGMANRIGEMADRILVMADNIGLMADRILITQQLQNSNIVLTQNSILATQQNVIALSGTVATLAYNPALASLLSQANALAVSMELVSLNPLNMAIELARIESQAALYLAQVVNLYALASQDSASASHYLNGDTLTWAGDLSGIHRGLALSLEIFADAVNQLAASTSTPVLADATSSMLRLSQDIGVMSDRIMEMVDRIVVMSDNIGLMSTRVADTQSLQQTNIEFTAASLLAASNTTVDIIATYGL